MSVKDVINSMKEWLSTPEVATDGVNGWGKNADPRVVAELQNSSNRIEDAARRFFQEPINKKIKVQTAEVKPPVKQTNENGKGKGYQR